MILFPLRKFVAPEFVFGVGARRKVGFYARNLQAKRAFVVSDPGIDAAGWLRPVLEDLEEAGLTVASFLNVTPNPRDHEVMSGADAYRAGACDIIVAVGGGSVIDCAKGVGIIVANGGHIREYEGVDAIPLPGPPLITIPTTAGTSADISQFAIFTDAERRAKIAVISKTAIPDVALVDPETTLTMSPRLTAGTGLDALTHAVEAYVPTAGSPVVDVHALAAIRGVRDHLLDAVARPDDMAAREHMMLASLQAGLAFSNASLGAVHALAHGLGGRLDLPHGESNALLLEHVVAFNFEAAPERFARIAKALRLNLGGLSSKESRRALTEALRDLRIASGLDGGLSDRGVTTNVIAELAEPATRDACIFTNPRRVSAADAKVIYAEALSDVDDEWIRQRDRIIGLGERSVHKNYYPVLRRNLSELKNLSLAVEQAPIGVAVVNLDRLVEFANPAFAAVTGRSKDQIVDLPIAGICEGTDAPLLLRDHFAQIMDEGKAWRGNVRFRHGDGTERWGRLAINPIQDESGAVARHVVMLEDVTERRATVERLRMAARVFSSSRDGILITDGDANIVDVNAAFEAMTGYARDELIGQKTSILRSQRHGRPFFQEMWGALKAVEHWEGEIWNRKRGGDVYPQWTSINAIRGEGDAVAHYVAICTDITERKAAEARIQHLAFHDDLTGLPNRFLLGRRFSLAAEVSRSGGLPLALLYVDLDRFKNVNDILGHNFGDKLLRTAAGRLTAILRPTDTVARLGGDEFIILAGELAGVEAAADVARRIEAALSEPYQIDGHEVSVLPSIGIALFPSDGTDLETLRKSGDAAMYHAKRAGRGRFQFFDKSMDRRTMEFFRTENALRGALKRGEFSLHYQPQVDLVHGKWVGVEALLRWNSPTLGRVPPDRFISVAEETGLILPIGAWVLDEACRQAAAWRRSGVPDLQVAVNLSMTQFRQGDLVEMTRAALAREELPPNLLELEVTESVLMLDSDHTIRTLRALRGLGVGLAIDDFGTGYSSLAYLKRFPVDKLKIDKTFVNELTTEADDERICRAIISLSDAFRLRVVAEGVETEGQRDWLRDAGCELGQGYLFARPAPAADLAF